MDEKVTITELYNAYVECRTKKRGTIPCADFELNEAANLYDLWIDLNTGTYEIGDSDALRVTLHPLKVYLQPISHGMAFIGFYIKDGRIYTGNRTISHLYDLIRLQRDAEDKAFHVERFARRYNSLAGFLVHTYSYNIRCRAWYSIDQETKTYLEEPGWDFKKIQPLNQYTSITKIKNLYYAQSRFAKRRVG